MSSNTTDASQRFSNVSDFVIRKEGPSLLQIIVVFMAVLLLCMAVIVLNLDKIPLIICLFLFLASLGSYMIVLLQRSRDLLLTTEFQNALFASALDYNRTFCLIIKNDGHIVYMDRSFQKIFPGYVKEGHLSLASFLNYSKIDSAEADKIYAAIDHNVGDRVICTLHGSDGKVYRQVISVEPISRPSGFVMLHARTYVELRREKGTESAVSSESVLLSKSSLSLFSAVMDKMDMGVYVLDAKGAVIYANKTLERWLDYNENEIAQGDLTFSNLVVHQKMAGGMVAIQEFEGEIPLVTKHGSILHLFANQKVIFDDSNNALGCMTIVSPFAERRPVQDIKITKDE